MVSLCVMLLVRRFECGLACVHQIHHLVEWGGGEGVEVAGERGQYNSTFDCLWFIFGAQ